MLIGVVGAGTMGSGIAEALVRHGGYQVLLSDATEELANRGRDRILASLKRQLAKGRLTEADVSDITGRLSTCLVDGLKDCDLVVEAIIEVMAAKRQLFEHLDVICGPEAILATNTSSLSVTEIGRGLNHAVVGMHFFNPAPVMKLVEVIAGAGTPPATVEAVRDIAVAIGKTPVTVQEGAGFVVNRILIPMINEAIEVVANGTATIEDIDAAMQLGANHPMGPLALGDLVGLDVVLAIMEVLQSETGDPKYRPHPLLRKYVRAGWLGRKTGRGFHHYPAS
ncbi:3-hydroxyacyl-CoA dehydrogenase NAD-binding domain-containing protein [Tessaracoccus sp. Z1128]